MWSWDFTEHLNKQSRETKRRENSRTDGRTKDVFFFENALKIDDRKFFDLFFVDTTAKCQNFEQMYNQRI